MKLLIRIAAGLVVGAFLLYLGQLAATVVVYGWGQLALLGLPVQYFDSPSEANLAIQDFLYYLNDFIM